MCEKISLLTFSFNNYNWYKTSIKMYNIRLNKVIKWNIKLN